VEHAPTTPVTATSVARRVFAQALLAVHLVVFVLGGAFGALAPAQSSLHRVAISAVAGGSEAPAVISSSDSRLELATRPRGDRGERSGGAPPLDFVPAASLLTIAPASLTGSIALPPARAAHRLLPSVVHGPRGPPHAC
jgi:hypothetical protein